MRSFDIDFHCFADDLQLYMPVVAGDGSCSDKLTACLTAVRTWLSSNFLLLNAAKTDMIAVGPAKLSHQFDHFTVSLDECVIHCGVLFDQTLSFEPHVKEVTKEAFFHLRKIAKIRSILSLKDAETLIHAFVTSRLDYCSVLLSGLPKKSLRSLQMVQNAAARTLTGLSRYEHISPVLAALHWLPVRVRADFKVLLLTYKILNGLAPVCLSDLVNTYVPVRPLCSLVTSCLIVPKVNEKSAGERAFSFRAPTLWNSLPLDIRHACSVDVFKAKLKRPTYIPLLTSPRCLDFSFTSVELCFIAVFYMFLNVFYMF